MNFVPNQLGVAANMALDPSDTQQFAMGQRLSVVHDVFGAMELIYGRAASAITRWNLCAITPTWNSSENRYRVNLDPVPNTANLGKSVAIALSTMATGQFGWFVESGQAVPCYSSANVAADTAFGITAAGSIGAITNGKQIVNARVVHAANQTFTITASGKQISGSTRVNLPHCAGLFEGMYVSGTGIAAGSYITDIAPDEKSIVLSAATTAAASGTMTFTPNNATIYYNRVQLNRAFAQGQVV